MHPTSILLALAAAALIHAAAIPDQTFDTCIDQYGTIFAGEPTPEIADCTGCAAQAVAAGYLAYNNNPENVQLAKDTYTAKMEECRNPNTDNTYDTCIEEYGTFFEGEPTPDIADCTGCAAQAVAAGYLAYDHNPANVELAKQTYEEEMEICRATN
ncbi:hypothetical protein Q9L58_001478 [Maublancomyces gigas]|uniref:Uncharacterized protein n=1 Tax=Discina gigas TaxID=1032678 RepID=A0ABR3GU61_9PEZI